MKNIVILGSTGSIGRSALEVIARFPERFRVVGLTAGRNVPLLLEQIRRFTPEVAAVADEVSLRAVQEALGSGKGPELRCGVEGISSAAAAEHAHVVISAIVGAAGLMPTLAAIRAGKTIALANKETLVMAGPIALAEAQRCGALLFPTDSEHSAIFQCLRGYRKEEIKRILLTASGGPFIGKTAKELETVSAEDALRHPNWSMGRKITIDSATLMNKGLEVIEARYLFDLPPAMIEVLIHPQSIIHSMVEFTDNSCIAQLSKPDMKGPIAYALSYPERLDAVLEPLAWETLAGLTFMRPDTAAFPCLALAYDALHAGGTMPAVLNAANEAAVAAFLEGAVGFNKIPAIIRKIMDGHTVQPADDLAVVLDADRRAREEARKLIARG
ncbi:MAG: 1-deoxy-D-xylulose-5-phosphate reductoisomerase [Nitrospirota bacterium]